jgi:hypothetical protein
VDDSGIAYRLSQEIAHHALVFCIVIKASIFVAFGTASIADGLVRAACDDFYGSRLT